METLIDQLYAYGKGVLPEPQRIQPLECLERAISGLSEVLPPGDRLTKALAPDLRTIQADPKSITRVFSNILANAAEAVKDGGEIRVRAENVSQIPTSEAGTKKGPYVHVHVADTGRGMPPEDKARVFDPYFTTRFIGRGLGMAEAYGVVKHYGGIIFLDSEPGRGTNVHVYLPAEPSPGSADQATDLSHKA